MSRSCATTAGANRNNAMAAIHFCITNNEFPALPSYRRKHCLPIGRRTRGTGTGSSRAGFAGIWAAGAARGAAPPSYVLLLATFAHWHASCHGYESVAHAENHASRQRPGVPAQTRRPAIGTLGSRTRTVLDDRQFHHPWPEHRSGPRRSGFRRSRGRIPAGTLARRGSPTGRRHALDLCHLAGGLSRAGLWYGGKSRLDALMPSTAPLRPDPIRARYETLLEVAESIALHRHLFALLSDDVVGDGARIDRQSVVVANAAQLADLFNRDVQLQQLQHLRVAVLVDHVNPLVRSHKAVRLAGERISAQAQVVGLHSVFVLQLVEGLDHSVMRGAIRDDPHFVAVVAHHLRLGNQSACGLELVRQTVHVVGVVVGPFAVAGGLVVPAE